MFHVTLETLSERKINFLSPADHTAPNIAQDTVFFNYESVQLAHIQLSVQNTLLS